MKIGQLRNMTEEERQHTLKELKEELFNLRFQQATNQLENPMRIVEVKKTIARVNTIIKEQELQIV
jgi:large subunit ribosomal protein L29